MHSGLSLWPVCPSLHTSTHPMAQSESQGRERHAAHQEAMQGVGMGPHLCREDRPPGPQSSTQVDLHLLLAVLSVQWCSWTAAAEGDAR